MKKTALLIFIISFFAAAADANEILKNVREKYLEINDFSAEVKQDGKNNVFNGILYFKKDNQFRLELQNMTIISDGQTIWNYTKKDNRVVISDVQNSESFPFSYEALLNEYPSQSNITARMEGKFNVLTFTPKPGSGLNYTRAEVWVNSENLIERVILERGSEGQLSLRITGYKLNTNIPQSRFTFTAPEGSKVIDLR